MYHVTMKAFVLFVAVNLFIGLVSSAPNVPLTRGVLTGVDEQAVSTQKPYHVYYAIPFAQPPLGSLRFQLPQPFYTNDANQIINSKSFQKACIQLASPLTNPQSEDCLYLNVYTPDVGTVNTFDPNTGRKVMVWIHGGGFTAGDAIEYRPSRLVTDYDVIVVTIQYRLGPFGFLSSGDEVLPGNIGLHDQVLALRWVKDNIRSFGGDPDDVTIFGESAGGVSTSILALSPLTKGLFSKVIMQSGSALAPWAVNPKPEETFYKMAEKAKCLPMFFIPSLSFLRPSNNRQILKCLERMNARDLHNLVNDDNVKVEETIVMNADDVDAGYRPVVDGNLIPMDPFSLVANKSYLTQVGALDRKYIIGFNNNEYLGLASAFLSNKALREMSSNVSSPLTQRILQENVQAVLPFPVTSEILNFASLMYLYPRDWQSKVDIQGPIDLFCDVYFVVPAIQLARALVKASQSLDVYVYLFDLDLEAKYTNASLTGSVHGLDIAYLFDENESPKIFSFDYTYRNTSIYPQSSLPLLDVFRGSLTNMAKTGNPSRPGNAPWPRFDLKEENYMALRPSPAVRQRVFRRRTSFWLDFLPRVAGAIFGRGPGTISLRI